MAIKYTVDWVGEIQSPGGGKMEKKGKRGVCDGMWDYLFGILCRYQVG